MDEEKNETNKDEISSNTESEVEKNLETEDSDSNKEVSKDESSLPVEINESNKEENLDEENKPKAMTRGENKKKIGIRTIIVIGTIICLSIIIIVKFTVAKYEDIVYPGISIYGNDLSKMTKEGLIKKINVIESEVQKKNISINAKTKEYDIKLKDIIKDYNKEKAISSVLEYGKDKNTIEKFFMILNKSDKEFNFNINIDLGSLETIISKIEKETNKNAKDPQIIIEENIKYKDGEDGLLLNKEYLISQIQKTLNEIDSLENEIEIEVKYEKESPKINIDDLKKVDTKISEYSTYYGGGNGRGSNIENAASKLDDILLMPGEEFSYEEAIGPVEASNGYKTGSVIINGKIEDGIGGGVCQVSSTLYNAQLKAGILPTQRRNHSKAVDYVPRGLDATLATGLIDYKFKNTYEYPLVLNTYTSAGKVYTEIWSNKNATKGIKYEAVGYASSNKANTYLYGYDKDGNKVYEKHIDTSIYK